MEHGPFNNLWRCLPCMSVEIRRACVGVVGEVNWKNRKDGPFPLLCDTTTKVVGSCHVPRRKDMMITREPAPSYLQRVYFSSLLSIATF